MNSYSQTLNSMMNLEQEKTKERKSSILKSQTESVAYILSLTNNKIYTYELSSDSKILKETESILESTSYENGRKLEDYFGISLLEFGVEVF